MKADHGDPSAGPQAIGQPAQCNFEPLQLVIHCDPQSLERSRGGVDAVVPRSRHRLSHDTGQVSSSADWRGAARIDNTARDSSTEPLLAVLKDQVRQVFGAKSFDNFPRGLAARRVEPQIEWASAVEAESSIRIGKLVAGQA